MIPLPNLNLANQEQQDITQTVGGSSDIIFNAKSSNTFKWVVGAVAIVGVVWLIKGGSK
ncbi:hypothetical protein ACPV36_19535 [Photobacterium damselae]|uniref:hypothetical protein n=1 Tax=Photobacterium damselae TaxID=38293 RepID=UPI004068A9C1